MKLSKFKGCRGESIAWQCWTQDAPIASVVISHGLGEHGGRYAPMAERLHRDGYNVFAIDHRGHGRSSGRRGDIFNFEDCIANLATLISTVVRPLGCPVILFGHSMGGAIATGYTLKHQGQFAALMLSGPALSTELVPGPMKLISKYLAKAVPFLPVLKIDASLVSRDPEQVRGYEDDPLNLHGSVPIRTVAELAAAIDPMPKQFSKITLPLLVMHGAEDQLIPADASKVLYDNCTSEDKTLKIYPHLYHEILNELPEDRARVLADISDWVHTRYANAEVS